MPPASKRVLDQAGQPVCGSVEGSIQGRCQVSDHDGLAAFQSGFQHAPLVTLAVLIVILVIQLDHYSRNVIANPAQRTLTTSLTFYSSLLFAMPQVW